MIYLPGIEYENDGKEPCLEKLKEGPVDEGCSPAFDKGFTRPRKHGHIGIPPIDKVWIRHKLLFYAVHVHSKNDILKTQGYR